MNTIKTSWGLIIDPMAVQNVSQVHKTDAGYQFTITFQDSTTNVVCATEQIAFENLVEVFQKSAVYKYKKKDRPVKVALWAGLIINALLVLFDIAIKHYKL